MKKMIAVLLALSALFALSACAGKPEEKPAEDTKYEGDAEKDLPADVPEAMRTAIVQMRTNTPASVVGADGTLYGGKREFAWEVADYLVSGGYKSNGQWNGDKYAELSGTVVTYKAKGDADVCAVIDYEAASIAYYSKNADGSLYYSLVSPSLYEEYTSDGASAAGVSVTDVAVGFTYDKENDVRRTWTIDANGYKYTTGSRDYMVSNTKVVDDSDNMERIFYIVTSGGGYEIRTDCAYLTGIEKLAMYDEHVTTDESGEFDSTYVALVGSKGELAWPDGADPTTYGTCSYTAVTAGRGWLWNSVDHEIEDLTMIAIGQAEIPTALDDYKGLINEAGIDYDGFDVAAHYDVKCEVLGHEFTEGAVTTEMDAAVESAIA